MPFDWFTVAAQSINFVVLLWLLKRFLYKPIIDGLDAREQRLQDVLNDANRKNFEAQELKKACEKNQQEFEQQRASILKATQEEAEEKGKKLLKSAHQAADDMLRKRLAAIQHELQRLQQQVLSRNIDEVYATAAKMLKDLAAVDLQQTLVNRFLERLKTLPVEQLASFSSALDRSNKVLIIRSAFALSSKDKNKISSLLSTLVGKNQPTDLKFNFILVPQLIAGLELTVSGWKLPWSITQHLQVLRDSVSEAVLKLPYQGNTTSEIVLDIPFANESNTQQEK